MYVYIYHVYTYYVYVYISCVYIYILCVYVYIYRQQRSIKVGRLLLPTSTIPCRSSHRGPVIIQSSWMTMVTNSFQPMVMTGDPP